MNCAGTWGSQMDIANLTAEDVDWGDQTICYDRQKLKNREDANIKHPLIHFGQEVTTLLRTLPQAGPLFPNLRAVQSKDRANEFRQRCHGLGITGTLCSSSTPSTPLTTSAPPKKELPQERTQKIPEPSAFGLG
jgi:hypothetical protein